MAYSTDALTYRLTFTDGTFITLINRESNTEPMDPGEYTFILPNAILGDFNGSTYSVTKYDSKGNKYVFSERGVVINDTADFTATGSRFMLSYNPVTGVIDAWKQSPAPELLPAIRQNTLNESVTGICYMNDVSGSGFGSLGEAIARGEYYYNRNNRGWYRITNVLNTPPFYTANTFYGSHSTTNYFWNECINRSVNTSMGGYNMNINDIIEDYDPEPKIEPTDDPYDPDNTEGTTPGGGGGGHDLSSDSIDIPSLPTLSAVDTGFLTIYNPTLTQLKALSDYLWSPLFDVDTLKKLVADPMDLFLGLSIVPVAVPDGGTRIVKVGGFSTGISMTVAAQQYVEVDCGSITVNEYWGAYLDYEPFTQAQLYLPFIGTHPIAIDDVMGKTITIKYHVDILSGSCIAYVKCGNSVLYSFIGQCSSSIPINSNDWTNVINGALNIAAAIGTMVATGGASAPAAIGTIATTAVNNLKPSIEKSGSLSGTGGIMAIQKPYLIITRPKQAIPAGQNSYMGYPSYITAVLSSLSGYTEFEVIHITDINATDEEITEIEELLKGGVIL